jgi:hypothetical protein
MSTVKITVRYDENNARRVADLHFGNVVVHVYGDARYLIDDFRDGYCHIEAPSYAHKIFAKYNMNKLQDPSNAALMSELRTLFVDENDPLVAIKSINSREIEVDVSQDEDVQNMFVDENFIELQQKLSQSAEDRSMAV